MTTECSVCFETYQNEGPKCPKLLPCSHTVCLSCLKRFTRYRHSQIKCPECQRLTSLPPEGAGAFPTNRYVLEILNQGERIDQLQTSHERANRARDAIVSHILHAAEYAHGNIILHGINAQKDIDAGVRVWYLRSQKQPNKRNNC